MCLKVLGELIMHCNDRKEAKKMYEQTHRLAYFLTIAYKKTDVECNCLGWINVRVGRSASDEHKLMFTAAVCYILCVIHCEIFTSWNECNNLNFMAKHYHKMIAKFMSIQLRHYSCSTVYCSCAKMQFCVFFIVP